MRSLNRHTPPPPPPNRIQSLLRRRAVVIAAAVVAVIVLGVFYANATPESGLYPRCVFKMLTGLSCPGCGSQRAIHSMLGGDFVAAFRHNALFVVELPLIALLLSARVLGSRAPKLNRLLSARFFILFILATIIIWTIVRNIFDV